MGAVEGSTDGKRTSGRKTIRMIDDLRESNSCNTSKKDAKDQDGGKGRTQKPGQNTDHY